MKLIKHTNKHFPECVQYPVETNGFAIVRIYTHQGMCGTSSEPLKEAMTMMGAEINLSSYGQQCESAYLYESCGCELCELIHKILRSGEAHTYPFVWADPRRMYSENEDDFIKRVPDGFIKFPENHKQILRRHHPYFYQYLLDGHIDKDGVWLESEQ